MNARRAFAMLLAVAPAALAGAQSLGRFDNQAIADAVRATVAEMPRLPDPQARADFSGAATPAAEQRRAIDRAFEAAAKPDCLRADALKHAPPVIHVAGIPVMLGGVLAMPHLFYAASTGKCK